MMRPEIFREPRERAMNASCHWLGIEMYDLPFYCGVWIKAPAILMSSWISNHL